MSLFIKIATGIIVLLYIIVVNRHKAPPAKKSLKSPLKNDFTAFGYNKPQQSVEEVLKLLGHEMSQTDNSFSGSQNFKGSFHEAIKNKTQAHENTSPLPTFTDRPLPADSAINPQNE